jgi:DNA-binding transcriptional MerR regulator
MTDEELEALIKEISEQIDQLPDDPEKPLTKEEKNRKLVLQLKKETLEKIKTAKKKGNLSQEVRASVDYSLLTQYGEKHPFLMSFMKSQLRWWGL